MKAVRLIAGIILMIIGISVSFTTNRLQWGWLTIPASVVAIVGYQLYRKGKEL